MHESHISACLYSIWLARGNGLEISNTKHFSRGRSIRNIRKKNMLMRSYAWTEKVAYSFSKHMLKRLCQDSPVIRRGEKYIQRRFFSCWLSSSGKCENGRAEIFKTAIFLHFRPCFFFVLVAIFSFHFPSCRLLARAGGQTSPSDPDFGPVEPLLPRRPKCWHDIVSRFDFFPTPFFRFLRVRPFRVGKLARIEK